MELTALRIPHITLCMHVLRRIDLLHCKLEVVGVNRASERRSSQRKEYQVEDNSHSVVLENRRFVDA